MKRLVCFLSAWILCVGPGWAQVELSGALDDGAVVLTWTNAGSWIVEGQSLTSLAGATEWVGVTTTETGRVAIPLAMLGDEGVMRVTQEAEVLPPAERARYRMVFDSVWSEETHPNGGYPGAAAHYTTVVGVNHNAAASFWAPGELATPGLEVLAETGGTVGYTAEITVEQTAGNAGDIFQFPGFTSPGVREVEFEITQAMPRVTVATMVAPSPDWFVGVSGLSLLGPDGNWMNVSRPLMVYDAGTEIGFSFSLNNPAESPPLPIFAFTFPPVGTVPYGTLRFERIE